MGSKKYSGWDADPRLDEARVLAPEILAHRSRKNTRRWCRGKVGVEHVTEIETRFPYGWSPRPCHWSPGRTWYSCYHVDRCTECRKILRHLGVPDCPDYRPRES